MKAFVIRIWTPAESDDDPERHRQTASSARTCTAEHRGAGRTRLGRWVSRLVLARLGLAVVAAALAAIALGGAAFGSSSLSVSITKAPPDPSTSSSATFEFTASERATFRCSLDGAGSSCRAPVSYSGLTVGRHVFIVVAENPGGIARASYQWRVTSPPPGPPPPTPSPPPPPCVPGGAGVTVLCFEDLASGTTVTDQYLNIGGPTRGVVFDSGPTSPTGAGSPKIDAPAGGKTHSGTRVAATAGCSVEVCNDRPIWGRFPYTKSFVRAYVGGNAPMKLTAFNANGAEFPAVTKHVGDRADTVMEVVRPTAEIAYFKLVEDVPSYEERASILLDDLTFDNPAEPPAPDFGISRSPDGIFDSSGAVAINKGHSVDVKIVVTRVNGSAGDLVFSVSSLPAGVTAAFKPTATTSAQTVTLKLSASADAVALANKTITVTAKPSASAGAKAGPGPRSLSFPLTILASFDLRLTGIEVTQGIQSEFERCFTPAACTSNKSLPPANSSRTYSYDGVDLARGKRTVVRVFGNLRFPADGAVDDVGAMLYGFTSSGKALAGSPLMPDSGRRTLTAADGHPWVTFHERVDPKGAFTFTLPDAWTERTHLTLRAELIPPDPIFLNTGPAECESSDCSANNELTVTGVYFVDTGYLDLAVARLYVDGETLLDFPLPKTALSLTDLWLPLRDGGLRYDPYSYYAGIDVSDDRDDKDEVNDDLEDYAEDYPGCEDRDFCADMLLGLYSANVDQGGTTSGTLAPFDGTFESAQPVSVVYFGRPGSIAHELSHGISRVHSDLYCGGDSDGQTGEAWPPDDWGLMQGIGVDTRPGSGAVGVGAPYAIVAPKDLGAPPGKAGSTTQQQPEYFDYMSYCHYAPDQGGHGTAGDSDRWTSVIGQQENVKLLSSIANEHGRLGTPAFHRAAARAGVPLLRVHAIAKASSRVRITKVKPRTGPPELLPPSSPYHLVVRDNAGAVLSDLPMQVDRVPESTSSFLSADVAAAHAAEVEIRRNGVKVAERVRSAMPPVVKVLTPRPRTRIGLRPVVVRWRATDRDGDRLAVKLDLSADGGRWRPLWAGPNLGHVTVPATAFPASRRLRIRVRANDGFNEVAALSGILSSLGTPPRVRIVSPAARQRVESDSALSLSGVAYDDRSLPIGARALRWLDSHRLVGRGDSVSVAGLAPGKHVLRLVAHDRFGRSASASVAVRVLAAAPEFLRLRAPTHLRRGARRLVLRVASSLPARLDVGRQHFAVGRTARRVVLRVAPGRHALVLALRLHAEGKETRATVLVRRGPAP